MASISIIIFYLTASIFFLGQLARFNLGPITIPLFDLAIILTTCINLVALKLQNKLKIANKPLSLFLGFSWLSLLLNLLIHHFQIFPSGLYLVRLTAFLLLLIFPPTINHKYSRFLNLVLLSNVIFGLIQYFLWPDFTAFKALNWDPHLYRLVSTFFDPTFTGLIYLIFFIKIYFSKNYSRITYYVLLFTIYLALALTYSRSTYLSLLAVALIYSIKIKNIIPTIFTAIILVLTILILPRNPGEGTKLERTSSIKAKIENYQEGLAIFTGSPLIGFGYNNLAQVRQIKNPRSHANSGFDGSLMTIMTTTGIIGLFLFLIGARQLFFHQSLMHQLVFVAIVIHSIFANSLLYPWVLFLLVFI